MEQAPARWFVVGFLAFISSLICLPAADAKNPDAVVELTLFWKPGCPYCAYAKSFLSEFEATEDWLAVEYVDISKSVEARQTFLRASRYFGISPPSVPLMIVGASPIVGFDDASTTGQKILTIARKCRLTNCPALEDLLEGGSDENQRTPGQQTDMPDSIKVPFFDEVDISAYSLPALTILLAAIDGFNPCAMWILVFLVGLLLGMQDRFRMWILGGAFLLTSGVVYFGFLTAWLNLFLALGAILWIRIAVGVVALTSGFYYIVDFFKNKAAECQVTRPRQRLKIMNALKASVSEKRFLLALGGIIALAAAVNLIEFFCSAGIPAVYTQVLANNALSTGQYYALIALYVVVFILDDAVIFVLAMLTLDATGMTTRYLRVSHLVGGFIMTAIGLMLIFTPNWLTFYVQ